MIYFYTLLFSQSFTVKGTVIDKKTQKSLIGANVFIVGTSIGTSTDKDGKYRLPNVQLGSYKLKASYIGYQEVEVDITVTSTEDITQDFELSYVSLEGEVIEVTAQAKDRLTQLMNKSKQSPLRILFHQTGFKNYRCKRSRDSSKNPWGLDPQGRW